MRKLLYIFLTVGVLGLTAACKSGDDDGNRSAIRIVEAQTSYPQAHSTGLIKFEAVEKALATSNQEWCTASVSGQTVTVSVEENQSIETRNATITIAAAGQTVEVDIIQQGILLLFPPLETAFSFKAGHSQTLDFNELPYPVSVVSVPEWLDSTFEDGILTLTTKKGNSGAEIMMEDVVVSILDIKKKYTAIQVTDPRSYYAFLGDYEFSYNTNYTNTGTDKTITISIVQDVERSSYFIRGILSSSYQSLVEIPMQYDPETRGLATKGKILGKNASGYDIWWLPMNSLASSTSRSTNYGMVSVIDGDYWNTIEFTDNGYNPTSFFTAGFRVRIYNESTAVSDATDAMFYWKLTKL